MPRRHCCSVLGMSDAADTGALLPPCAGDLREARGRVSATGVWQHPHAPAAPLSQPLKCLSLDLALGSCHYAGGIPQCTGQAACHLLVHEQLLTTNRIEKPKAFQICHSRSFGW